MGNMIGYSVKAFMVVVTAAMLGGCVSAGTTAKVCADLGVIGKVVGAVNENAGQAIADYTPKKCANVGVNGDAGKLTGGVTAGVSNE